MTKKAKPNWHKKDTKHLISLVQHHSRLQWPLITKQLNSMFPQYKRTEKECRNRYKAISRQNASKNWIIEEDFVFFNLRSIVGNRWNKISSLLPNKTYLQLKNHFYSLMSKTLRHIIKKKRNSKHSISNHLLESFKENIQSYYILKIIEGKVNCNKNDANGKETIAEKFTVFECSSQHSSDLESKLSNEVTQEQLKVYTDELLNDISRSNELKDIAPLVLKQYPQGTLMNNIDKCIYLYIKKLLISKCLAMQSMQLNNKAKSKGESIISEFINENKNMFLLLSPNEKMGI